VVFVLLLLSNDVGTVDLDDPISIPHLVLPSVWLDSEGNFLLTKIFLGPKAVREGGVLVALVLLVASLEKVLKAIEEEEEKGVGGTLLLMVDDSLGGIITFELELLL
jgi:hypothetical protein